MVCLQYLYFLRSVNLPSKKCANVVLTSQGPEPLWVKAAELVSSPPPYLCCSHSLVPAHNISSMYFQSGHNHRPQSNFITIYISEQYISLHSAQSVGLTITITYCNLSHPVVKENNLTIACSSHKLLSLQWWDTNTVMILLWQIFFLSLKDSIYQHLHLYKCIATASCCKWFVLLKICSEKQDFCFHDHK